MHVTCKYVCLVVCYMMVMFIDIEVGSSGIHAVRNIDMSSLHIGSWDPTTQYDTGAIQKWQTKRQLILMDLMERQRLLDLKKAEAARQIAERRANKMKLRTNAHQAFLEERMKADAMAKDKHQSPSLNDIFISLDNHMGIHSGSNDLSNRFTPDGNDIPSGNINQFDANVFDHGVLSENIGVATRREPIDNINPINKDLIVDNANIENNFPINAEAHVPDSIAVDAHIVPKDSIVPVIATNGQIDNGPPTDKKSTVDEEKSPNARKGILQNDGLANKSPITNRARPNSTITTNTIVTAGNIAGDTAAVVPDAKNPIGTGATPVDVGFGEFGTNPIQEEQLRTLENETLILGPQEHALDVVINPNLNRLRGDKNSHKTESTTGTAPNPNLEATPLVVASEITTEKPVDSTIPASTLTTTTVENVITNDPAQNLKTILNFLSVKGGIDPNLSTTQLLQDEHIRGVLVKVVENITRLLSLESQTQSPRRVDVFHHVHMHNHDPHDHGSVETVVQKGGNPFNPLVSSPGFVVNDLPFVDLTRPDASSEMGTFNHVLGQQNNLDVKRSTDATVLAKPASGILNGGMNAIFSDPVRNDPLLAGIPADAPRQVDIINILSSTLDDLTPKVVGVHEVNTIDIQDGGQSVMAPTTVTPPISDINRISTHPPPGGIQTLNGGLMPMPQVSNFTPQTTGKDLSVLSFLSAIRDRLKG